MIHFKHLDSHVQDDILNSYVVINNKIDLLAFAVRPNSDKTLSFFGKEGKPLNVRKLVLVNFYNDAIQFFELHKDKLFHEDFVNKTFFMEFWSDESPNLRKPPKAPKNNFILSYAVENKQVIPPNSPILRKFAEVMEIDPPPVIWEGNLLTEQKEFLLELAYADEFTQETFNMMYLLFPNSREIIKRYNFEGLVIYYPEDKSWMMTKIVDPEYTQKIKEKISKENEADETEKKIIDEIFTSQVLLKLEISSNFIKDPWDFLFAVLNTLGDNPKVKELKRNPDVFFDIDFEKIPEKIKEYIGMDEHKKELFRIIFSIFTASSAKKAALNWNIDVGIAEKIQMLADKYDMKNIKFPPSKKKKKEDEENSEELEQHQNEGVSLIVGRFQPPHLGHIKMVEFASYPPVFCIVNTGIKERSPFPLEYIIEVFEKFIEDGYLPENTQIFTSTTGYLPDFIEENKLNVKEILAGSDRIEGYRNQFPPETDIEFIQTIRYFKGEDVRKWIKEEDRNKLAKALPDAKYVSWYLNLFKPFV